MDVLRVHYGLLLRYGVALLLYAGYFHGVGRVRVKGHVMCHEDTSSISFVCVGGCMGGRFVHRTQSHRKYYNPQCCVLVLVMVVDFVLLNLSPGSFTCVRKHGT